ncbi:sigma-54-dependent Fis family transcriptional regulator [Bacillus sp. FSL W7-1360]
MKRALLIGEGAEVRNLAKSLQATSAVHLSGVFTTDKVLQKWAQSHQLQLFHDESALHTCPVDVFIANQVHSLAKEHWSFEQAWDLIYKSLDSSTIVEAALNAIQDGIITVDRSCRVVFMNEAASKMAGLCSNVTYGASIHTLLPSSGLPRVIETATPEYHQMHTFANGTTIVTTRVPLFKGEECAGAIAIFKDVTEARQLGEQLTDLKSIQTMLEAIIHSSNDAISVVDENGFGLLINPAYTRMTGLEKEDIIGKPATADISEGDSMHMHVLKTKKAVRGARLKLGPKKRDVIVNVAPIIVDDTLKGSVGIIHDVSELTVLTQQLRKAKQRLASLEAKYSFEEIVGASPEMRVAIEQAKLGATTSLPILLLGETGTGKELFAHAIHHESERYEQPFIRVNCAALSETLLESELFGYEAGAFSGAHRQGKRGLFEEADGGSLFLDEVGELSPTTQAKLLRVLQEKEFVRVGGTKPIPIDVRIIAATNVNLQKAIACKQFREDLYYRLSKLPIQIPALRERKGDLPLLVQHLLQKLNADYGYQVQAIVPNIMKKMAQYHWPGNVRELENILARSMIYTEAGARHLSHVDLPGEGKVIRDALPVDFDGNGTKTLKEFLSENEKNYIATVLKEVNGVKTEAAKKLDISVRSLYYKMEKHHLE